MDLTPEIIKYIDKSVLCWLATVSADNIPNISPKEIFTYYGTDRIIIANIASPQSVRNIKHNENICVSFIDVLVQKGFQIIGKAKIIYKTDLTFAEMEKILHRMTDGKFPFTTITEIWMDRAKPIIAPRYLLYPETSEEEQIQSARKSYGF
jgi:predicted pyridoxine 5'-phosphate oxidase superfamily flavin-nucleotide-binding protein